VTEAPTALNKRGSKVFVDDFKFDSQKEANFFNRFVKNCHFDYIVHPRFVLEKAGTIGTAKVRQLAYTPDFVILDRFGKMMHVYDVKNSFGVYGIDTAANMRFNLFARRYKIPVEAVVVRAHDFKSIAQCVTKKRKIDDPLICTGFDYEWIEATNYLGGN
jgi:hypothetical protein